jgi:hypothetical protein
VDKNHEQQAEHSLTKNIRTNREVSAYLRLMEATVCNLAAPGELPEFKIGKS